MNQSNPIQLNKPPHQLVITLGTIISIWFVCGVIFLTTKNIYITAVFAQGIAIVANACNDLNKNIYALNKNTGNLGNVGNYININQ